METSESYRPDAAGGLKADDGMGPYRNLAAAMLLSAIRDYGVATCDSRAFLMGPEARLWCELSRRDQKAVLRAAERRAAAGVQLGVEETVMRAARMFGRFTSLHIARITGMSVQRISGTLNKFAKLGRIELVGRRRYAAAVKPLLVYRVLGLPKRRPSVGGRTEAA